MPLSSLPAAELGNAARAEARVELAGGDRARWRRHCHERRGHEDEGGEAATHHPNPLYATTTPFFGAPVSS